MEDKHVLEPSTISRMSLEDAERFLSGKSRPRLTTQSWSSVREFCVGKMQKRDLSNDQRIRWGELAVQAARLLHSEGGIDELYATSMEVFSRSYMITNFGPGELCSVRDPRDLVLHSIEKIGRAPDEVSRVADDWHQLPVPEILFLRRIKNIMKPLQEVMGYLDEESLRNDLNAWLALIPKLP